LHAAALFLGDPIEDGGLQCPRLRVADVEQHLILFQRAEIEASIPGITMTLEEPRTVNLVFASAAALDAATLTVTLPDGIELAGFPGQREITWQTSLVEGKNFLPLELIALSSVGGEVLARLEHDDRDRTFRLRVEVS